GPVASKLPIGPRFGPATVRGVVTIVRRGPLSLSMLTTGKNVARGARASARSILRSPSVDETHGRVVATAPIGARPGDPGRSQPLLPAAVRCDRAAESARPARSRLARGGRLRLVARGFVLATLGPRVVSAGRLTTLGRYWTRCPYRESDNDVHEAVR